jgi:hypothetical protein
MDLPKRLDAWLGYGDFKYAGQLAWAGDAVLVFPEALAQAQAGVMRDGPRGACSS